MRFLSLRRRARRDLFVYLMAVSLALGSFLQAFGHSGAVVGAPTKVPTTINIDGTIDSGGAESVWAPGVPAGTLPNSCSEFIGMPPPPPVNFFALNDGVTLFMAFDIPDTSAQATDTLFLFFDNNHGGGTSPAADDLALQLTFNNVAANNAVPAAQRHTGAGAGWSAPTAGLPAGVDAKYTRITAGAGKWQLEMRMPSTGPTLGFALLYLNETGTAVGDCNGDGIDDDFYARFPSTLTVSSPISLPAGVANPSAWGNLQFGDPPPTVRFQPPLCCSSADITHNPSGQPFTAGVPVNINATVHNLHATSVATNVNVEIRVHNFGTGGTVVFSAPAQVPSIAPSGSASTPAVNWPSPPAGLHGCIRAQILPPTTNQYFIAAGQETAQRNIDVACVPQGMKKTLNFVTYNPEKNDQNLKIILAQQVLLPAGFKGLRFDLTQPNRPLRAEEEFPVQLVVTADEDAPLTDLPKQTAQVPPTAGGTAAPPLQERTGTEPIVVKVRAGERVHLMASGEVDIDGGGPIPAAGPNGQDVSRAIRERRPLLLRGDAAALYGGALIGSFDNFATSFAVGDNATFAVPAGVGELKLAVNDFDGGYGDNAGKGFHVEAFALPASNEAPTPSGTTTPVGLFMPAITVAQTTDPKVTLPQVNITATTTARVTVSEVSYDLLTNHGGLAYQLLVVDDTRGGLTHPGGPDGSGRPWFIYILLLLLILLALFFLFRWLARKKQSS
jgi:hypothetical protein